MPKGIWRDISTTTAYNEFGEVTIITTTRLRDGDNGDVLLSELKPEEKTIGYYDDVPDEYKEIVAHARKQGTPRISQEEHDRIAAADVAAKEMEDVRRGLLGANMAEVRNARLAQEEPPAKKAKSKG